MSKPLLRTATFFSLRARLVTATCLALVWLGACSSSSTPGGTGGAATGGTSTGGTTGTGGTATGGTATGGTSSGGVATGGASSGGRGGERGGSNGGAAGGSRGGASGGGGSSGGASGGASAGAAGGSSGGASGTMALTSTAYAEGQTIPAVHTCAGADTSPPLAWAGAPAGTKSFTLVLLDTTINFVHWVLWDIPASASSLPAMIDETSAMPGNVAGARQLSGQGTGFLGPCPSGSLHTYRFTLYAMPSEKLTVPGNATTMQIQTAAMQQALATATLSGTSNAKKP